MKIKMTGLLAGLGLLLAACGQGPGVEATELRFADQEPSGEPTPVRMLITPGYLRIDDGGDGTTFVLFSRRDRVIYNVNAADQTVLVIPPSPPPSRPPIRLTHSVKAIPETLPAVSGHRVAHVQLMTNDKVCYDVYAEENLLPGAVAAMRDFISVLGNDQAQSVPRIPPELLTPCYLANNIHAPARYLEHGFPIRRAEPGGRVSELVDYTEKKRVNPALFELPVDLRRMNIHELRGR
jgi:hypothetical protein